MSLTNQVLNALTTRLTPAMAGAIQTDVAAYYDPFYVGSGRDFLLGDFGVDDACLFSNSTDSTNNSTNATATAEATATVWVGNITGLGSVDVYYIELLPGTDEIESSLDGYSWSGTWKLNANFTNVTAEVNATLSAG